MAIHPRFSVLVDGYTFFESPRWHDNRLWLSDFYTHQVIRVDLNGQVEKVADVAQQPSGMGWLPDGRLLVVSMRDRKVLRQESDGRLVVHADLSAVAGGHANDMVVDAEGRAYVGNFGFDLDAAITGGDFAGALAAYEGAAIAMVEPHGHVHVVAAGMRFPNGMVLTPDGGTLVVAESLGRRLSAFDVGIDGTFTNQRVWAELGAVVPDGICLDAEGAVWVADAAASRCLRVAEGGEILQEVATTRPCYACMLGGPDGRTLFMMTAESSLPKVAGASRTGRIEITDVIVAHAGRP